jgi:hypothetical protein
LLKSQEYGSDCMRSIEIELLDDDDSQSYTDGELVLYIYSNSRVGTPRKYSLGIQISGFPGKTVFHGAVIPRSCNSNTIDFVRMGGTQDYMKEHNETPPSTFSNWQEDVIPGQEEKAIQIVRKSQIESLQAEVKQSGLDLSSTQMVLVDGFLLYYDPTIRSKLDVRLFFRLGRKSGKRETFHKTGLWA